MSMLQQGFCSVVGTIAVVSYMYRRGGRPTSEKDVTRVQKLKKRTEKLKFRAQKFKNPGLFSHV